MEQDGVFAHKISESAGSDISRKALEEEELDQVDNCVADVNENQLKHNDFEKYKEAIAIKEDINVNLEKQLASDIAACGDCHQKDIRAKFETQQADNSNGMSPLTEDRQELSLIQETAQTRKILELFSKQAPTDPPAITKQTTGHAPSAKFQAPPAELCPICAKRVYAAEKVQCDNRVFHKSCFKCKTCGINLRLETSAIGADGAVYCKNHHRELFNNMAKNTYNCSTKPVLATVTAE